MNATSQTASMVYDPNTKNIVCKGNWSILNANLLMKQFKQIKSLHTQILHINGESISNLDSAGALTLIDCLYELKRRKNQITLIHFSKQQLNLIALIEDKHEALHYKPPRIKKENFLYNIGKESTEKVNQIDGLIILIGSLSDKLFSALMNWRRFQFPSIVTNIQAAGINALPIIGLLSFLIGVVLAYQMGLQLETYGANIFIAYLSGMAIFREFSPLITAIIVAGRTSSSFTAQIGSMKINEEIDALNTMGLSPIELIVIPKVLGLLLIFPLLIFWSDIFAVMGAMIMSKSMLQIGFSDFLIRLQDSVGLKQLMLGLYKAPAFAILIALVGCFQGFQVQLNADSVGSQTTKSVVQALFLIIIADSVFSILYSWLDL